MKNIVNLKVEGKDALGFDTGLDAQAFAQAKMAQFITQSGLIVYPDGREEPWNALGVNENGGSMVIWGPAFPGESLAELVEDALRKEEALDAVRFWIKARLAAGEKANTFPGASGALVTLSGAGAFPRGTILFPPERIVKRCLEAGGEEAVESSQRYFHPDLEGNEAASFSAAAMLYSIFAGAPAFTLEREEETGAKKKADGQSRLETLRQDIREGVFLPPELASPGLDRDFARLLSEVLSARKQKEEKKRPSPEAIAEALGEPLSRKTGSWVKPLSGEETEKIENGLLQYRKSKNFNVKTRRFILRNTSAIIICGAALIALILGIRGFIKHRAELPNTKGLTPLEVAEMYYGAFGAFDHMAMEACVIDEAGKDDITMVTNLFVISRVRQAYEPASGTSLSAREWIDAGRPETEQTVFGITDLKINARGGSAESGEVNLEAVYTLWIPAGFAGDEGEAPPEAGETFQSNPPPRPPSSFPRRDRLKVIIHKDAWRISEMTRERS